MAAEISVIVPVRDGAGHLAALLDSLAAQTLAAERFEVIVVDNASRDGTSAVARRAGALVVHEPVPNRSRARNRGVKAAGSDLFAFTDADCVAHPGWLDTLLGCGTSAPLLAGPVRTTTGDPPNAVERFEALWRFSQESWTQQGWAATANLRVRRDAFAAVGGFDPAYPHNAEDADFCIRAGRAGLRLAFCPGAYVCHPGERRLAPMLRRAFWHGHGASQALRRIGVGQETWRDPVPLVRGDRAMAQIGLAPGALEGDEWRRMRRLARLAYAARFLGSIWATVSRAR